MQTDLKNKTVASGGGLQEHDALDRGDTTAFSNLMIFAEHPF
jgi:hypothetical protein